MPVFKIHHITQYKYEQPVFESVNEIRIYPFPDAQQEILQHDLRITGYPEIFVYSDYWGNRTGQFSLLQAHQELVIESQLMVRTTGSTQLQVNFQGTWDQLRAETGNKLQLLELTRPDTIQNRSLMDAFVSTCNNRGESVASMVEAASEFVFKNFRYEKGITNIETTVDEILEHRGGVCQDFAHVLLQLLRNLSVPCRYVSGYICPNKNGMRGEGATHAWVEAWIPGFGWAGIDPTNNVWITNNHVKLAVGRHFADCTPIKGTFKGPARQNLFVFVAVGYEDGHSFEETTQVQLKKQADDKIDVSAADSFIAQQQ